ncbi:hypothetical protein SAMN05216179_2856 [Gracilibacillus kekensis]|uniref:Uncharacterized protein n=1 Tax=Gracilibacillus kekensis TaxID=1027249 RepID=A0A1M7Q7I5_9BACI|nr:hypothetical protein SAMN05216179_2856 [Gracilibacillus kekensis]
MEKVSMTDFFYEKQKGVVQAIISLILNNFFFLYYTCPSTTMNLPSILITDRVKYFFVFVGNPKELSQ